MKYIALLRGINVGGKNKISMAELKEAFTGHGFTDVSSYINSGNILFSSDSTDESVLKTECEQLIESKFKLQIIVCIVSAKTLVSALQHAPAWWGDEDGVVHNVLFVIPPATAAELVLQVGIASEYEKIEYFEETIFWSAARETYPKAKWSKMASTSAYKTVTIRNANTARKLAMLAADGK